MSTPRCIWCGKFYAGKHATAKFCGTNCRVAWHRWQHRTDYLEACAHNAIQQLIDRLGSADVNGAALDALCRIHDQIVSEGEFIPLAQMSFPAEAYRLENLLGSEDETGPTLSGSVSEANTSSS